MALARENPELYERLVVDHGAEGFEEHGRERPREKPRRSRERDVKLILLKLRLKRLLRSVPWGAVLEGLGVLFGDLRSLEEAKRAYRRWKRARARRLKEAIEEALRLPPRRTPYEEWKREVGLVSDDEIRGRGKKED